MCSYLTAQWRFKKYFWDAGYCQISSAGEGVPMALKNGRSVLAGKKLNFHVRIRDNLEVSLDGETGD
jgi:hypothetical protein